MGMADKKYAAAVDQGTTGTRFMVFSHDGKVVSTDYLEHEQMYPKPGWVEHDPMEIWDKTARDQGLDVEEGHQGRRALRDRRHQPARDDRCLGEEDRQAGLQRHRLARHSHHRYLSKVDQ